MKRILLFVLTNIAVMVMVGIITSLFGLGRYTGTNTGQLMIFSLVVGFTGSIISLLMSKTMAKMSMGVKIINQPATADEAWIVDTVRKFADQAGIDMPEVGIYEGEPNAFATGAFKNSALVAVSTGLLRGMTREEIEAVIGHEIAHVANGDMVTMALIQGVMNTFVVFASRLIGSLVDGFLRRGDSSSGPGIGYSGGMRRALPLLLRVLLLASLVLGGVAQAMAATRMAAAALAAPPAPAHTHAQVQAHADAAPPCHAAAPAPAAHAPDCPCPQAHPGHAGCHCVPAALALLPPPASGLPLRPAAAPPAPPRAGPAAVPPARLLRPPIA